MDDSTTKQGSLLSCTADYVNLDPNTVVLSLSILIFAAVYWHSNRMNSNSTLKFVIEITIETQALDGKRTRHAPMTIQPPLGEGVVKGHLPVVFIPMVEQAENSRKQSQAPFPYKHDGLDQEQDIDADVKLKPEKPDLREANPSLITELMTLAKSLGKETDYSTIQSRFTSAKILSWLGTFVMKMIERMTMNMILESMHKFFKELKLSKV